MKTTIAASRMNDAFRILSQFPQIDSDTIKISLLKEGLSIYFRLKTGEELSLNLGGTHDIIHYKIKRSKRDRTERF